MQLVPSGNWEALSQKIVIGLQFWLHKMWLKIILDIHGMTHCQNWYDKQVTKLFYLAIFEDFSDHKGNLGLYQPTQFWFNYKNNSQ